MRSTRYAAANQERSTGLALGALAFVYFLLVWIPGFAGAYGYFIDEFYYLLCAERLDFGYVDHPPLSILLLRCVRAVIGDSLPAIRLVPALAGAGTVLLTGVIAGRLGANRFGQLLAAAAVMVCTPYHVVFSFYSMNALSVLLWTLGFWILVEIERRDEPRLWLVFGVVLGLGLENKHTFALLALGLAAGLVLTPARRHLTSRWFWLGGAIAFALLLPNLLWQATHDWASLEFYRAQDLGKNIPTPPLEVLRLQVLAMNPATLPIWGAGIVFFLASERGRRYRHLGWLFVVLLGLMLVGQKSRPDRIAAAYVILFAGGAVLLGARSERARWLRTALPALLIVFGAALAPVGVPLLPPQMEADYTALLGVVPQIERGAGMRSRLPQWMADRLGWDELTDDVARVFASLPPAERGKAVLLGPSYGQTAPIEFLGRDRGLPRGYSAHNNYFFWGPPPEPVEVAIVVGFGDAASQTPRPDPKMSRFFGRIELAHVHRCQWCMRWRDQLPIWIVRQPKASLREAWPELKRYM
jgi:hypothetical protein